jgi:DNA polymerase-3 subunit epsilon
MKVLIFDTETTGVIKHSMIPLTLQPHIIELGMILWDTTKRGAKPKEYTYLFNPGVKLEAVITKITGLTNQDLDGKPTFSVHVDAIAAVVAKADMAIAHNVDFDHSMINNECLRCGKLQFPWPTTLMCTVRQYEHAFGYRPNLQQLYLHVIGKPLAQTHRALDDCRALLEIVRHDRRVLLKN